MKTVNAKGELPYKIPRHINWDVDDYTSYLMRLKAETDPTFRRCFTPRYDITRMFHHRLAKKIFGNVKSHFVIFIRGLVGVDTGTGAFKCQRKGTNVMMNNGTTKKVEDLKIGDQLMGDDGRPRTILELHTGQAPTYQIKPVKGEPFSITGNHTLCLICNHTHPKKYQAGEIKEITLNNYMLQNKKYKHLYKLYRVPTEYSFKPVLIDPYYLGIWLGDGDSTTPRITKPDSQIRDYIKNYAKHIGMKYSTYSNSDGCPTHCIVRQKNKKNWLLKQLHHYNLINNKHIPEEYLHNTKEIRLQLLAGLLDTDGTKNHNGYSITQKRLELSQQIKELALSLGFYAHLNKFTSEIKSIKFKGTYYAIGINGHVNLIPTKIPRKQCNPRQQIKDVRHTGFTIIPEGINEYVGFTLDGNGRYLLPDFIVTHNSSSAIELMILYDTHPDVNKIGFSNDDILNKVQELVKIQTQTPHTLFIRDETPESLRIRSNIEFNTLREAIRQKQISFILVKPELENLNSATFVLEPMYHSTDLSWVKHAVYVEGSGYIGYVILKIHLGNTLWTAYSPYKNAYLDKVVARQTGQFQHKELAQRFMKTPQYKNCISPTGKLIPLRVKKYLREVFPNVTNDESSYIRDSIKEIYQQQQEKEEEEENP